MDLLLRSAISLMAAAHAGAGTPRTLSVSTDRWWIPRIAKKAALAGESGAALVGSRGLESGVRIVPVVKPHLN
jgi:hypothetical protein